jgi:hypothetical protein
MEKKINAYLDPKFNIIVSKDDTRKDIIENYNTLIKKVNDPEKAITIIEDYASKLNINFQKTISEIRRKNVKFNTTFSKRRNSYRTIVYTKVYTNKTLII